MTIEPGQTLVHYRIVEKLGEGGMGVVWKAVDTTLDREVAIKVLPEAFAGEADRLARFEQEARLLASLNHPNIAAVYSVHRHEGIRFLAMELVAGEDLAVRLARGPLPLDDALEIALQIAQALEAAHDNGVIHRDLKPANIQLTPAGKIKVLDFGLAKGLSPEPTSGDHALSPTITSAGTVAGMILGTAGYMSPEQARGRAVDRRADIWAFGCVLYEMLSGHRTFDGDTLTDTLASILKTDPDWDALPDATPAAIRRLTRRCLTRDADKRLAHISGALPPLRDTIDGVEEAAPSITAQPVVESSAGFRRSLPWALVALLALVTGLALWNAADVSETQRELLSLVAPFPSELITVNNQMGILALSPDGRTMALTLSDERTTHLYVRKLDETEPVMLPGTENAATPFFSPDGQWIGFFANSKLKKIRVDGEHAITLCDSSGNNRGATWGSDGRIVFSSHYTLPLSQVSDGGGEPTALTTIEVDLGERTHRWPYAVPNEDLVLFTVGMMDSPENYDGARIDAIRPSTGERKTILEGASIARYVPGYLLFAREGFVFASRFDLDRLELQGTPVPVVGDVMGMRASGIAHFGVSAKGLLAYIAGEPASRVERLVWLDHDGTTEPLPTPVDGYLDPRLSPDRKSIAVAVEGESTFDIWVFDIERGTLTRLTFDGDNTWPSWSPDGKRIAFASVRDNASMSTYIKNADGSGEAELFYSPDVHENAGQATPGGWSPDGRTLLVNFTDQKGSNILALDTEEGTTQMLLDSPAGEYGGHVSPDGRWMLYSSDESGRFEVYVRPFPGDGGKWQISADGGSQPRWSRDGTRLFFRSQSEILVVDVGTRDDRWQSSRPRQLLDGFPAAPANYNYDVVDRDRFVIVQAEQDENRPLGVTVVVNWLDELRRRVPYE